MVSSKNIPVLNSLRALAALSVCLFHFICTVTGFVNNDFFLRIFSFGHYGVQMFFVISGFVIPWSMYYGGYRIKNFFTFTLKRLIRLEPPYLISLLFAIIHTYIRTFSNHYNGVDITPSLTQILLHFGYLIPFFEGQVWIRQVYWTLAIEFQYYIAIGLLFPLIINKKKWTRFIIYLLFLIGPLLIKSNFLPFHLPVFLLGILLFLHRIKAINKIELFLVAILSCFMIGYFDNIGTIVFSGFSFFVILYFGQIKLKIGDFLGNISYSLYLFHSLTGMVILNYFAHTVTLPIVKFILIIIAVLFSIAAAYLVYRFVELPSKNFSSRIKYKNKIQR